MKTIFRISITMVRWRTTTAPGESLDSKI